MRTSLTRRSALGLLGAVPLAAGGAAVDTAAKADTGHGGTPTGPVPPQLLPGGAFDRYVSGLAVEDQFSGTVLLAWHGQPTLTRSYQEADKAKSIPNQAGTIFYVTSIATFLTGVAVTQLAAQGKVDFYATLGTYLDGFPSDAASSVTVDNLLTYTSGYPSNLANPGGGSGAGTTREQAFNAMLAALRTQELATTPGTMFADSSVDYFLAGAIIAATSGQYPWDYQAQHVFAPAGMTSTAFFKGEQWLDDPRFAHVYGPPVPGGQRQDITADFSKGVGGMSGGAGVFSTAPDLLRFANALGDGTLLAPEWAELRSAGKYPSSAQYGSGSVPGPVLVGYGSEERITAGGQRAYGHQGELQYPVPGSSEPGGLMAMVMLYPGLGVTAIALTNYYVNGGEFVAQLDRIITGDAAPGKDML